ncbi:MAG: hypothetical protein JXA03_12035 [Bacteroidales bacterium]|nr:hypothetical protein [Bacteroidales bacterium]
MLRVSGIFSFQQIANTDSLESLLPGTSGAERADLLNLLAQSFCAKDEEKALTFAKEALSHSIRMGYNEGRVTARLIIGSIYYQQGMLDKVLSWGLKTMTYFTPKTHWITKIKIYQGVGNIYRNAGKTDSAIIFYRLALENMRDDESWACRAETHRSMALIYLSLRDAENELKHLIQLKENILKSFQARNTYMLSYTGFIYCMELVQFYVLHGRSPASVSACREIWDSLHIFGDAAMPSDYFKAKIVGQMARINCQWGNYRTSLILHDSAIGMFKSAMKNHFDEIAMQKKTFASGDWQINLANQIEGKAIVQMYMTN